MLGFALPSSKTEAQAAGTLYTPNAWVHIADDNTITLISARSEMGQGVYTSMPMLIAEELNVSLKQIKVAIAPPKAVYVNALLGAQITGGSTSVRDGWEKLRTGFMGKGHWRQKSNLRQLGRSRLQTACT
jgi:isoquinoline 1-oxidoreductase beta subunit